MAEGMISPNDVGRSETLRDVAERYLRELENRCMIRTTLDERSGHGIGKSCQLHDLMQEFCLSKGREEGFIEVMNAQTPYNSATGKTRRLVVHLDGVKDGLFRNAQLENMVSLRSLLFLRRPTYDITRVHPSFSSFGKLKCLKVLILEDFMFKEGRFPAALRKLALLKHFSLKRSSVYKLPELASILPVIQSLDLRISSRVQLPNFVHKMARLRHLFLPSDINRRGGKRLSINALYELETLFGFHSSAFDPGSLHKFKNLRRFEGTICDMNSLLDVVDHLTNLRHQLQETVLTVMVEDLSSQQGLFLLNEVMSCGSLSCLVVVGRVRELWTYNPRLHLQNLVVLKLRKNEFEEDPMEMLQELPQLRLLKLSSCSFVGKEMACKATGFPQLKFLYIEDLPNLVKWGVEERAMPNLFYLFLTGCKNLEMIPDGLRFLEPLKELYVNRMSKKLFDRLRKEADDGEEGEDYHKIKHIPTLVIDPFNTSKFFP